MPETFTSGEVELYYNVRVPGLKRAGNEQRSPCPVHKGKRDSFAVNPQNGRAYCHSQCVRGWDMIQLERELTGATFTEARDAIFRIVGRPQA